MANVRLVEHDPRPNLLLAISVVLGSAAVAVALVTFRLGTVSETDVTNRPIQIAEGGYVSSDACQACHPQQYHSWHRSYHRTMTQVATPNTVIANFDGVQVDAVRGRPMRLERSGAEFWAEFDDPDSPGGQPPRIKRQIVMMTGSHEQQQYWYATGRHRLLSKLPAAYLIRDERWIPRVAVFMHPPDDPPGSDTGAWNAVCIVCHTTAGKPEIDTPFGSRPVMQQVVESKAVEFGIGCEACHGPGGEHARLNRNPQRRYWFHLTGNPDSTIVQPLRLDPQRSAQVCGQCHGIWEFYDIAGERLANDHGLPFRPGDELRDTRFVAQPTQNLNSPTMKEVLADDPSFVDDSFWPDGMVRVSGREYNGLIESPCFKNARDATHTMTCSSCHTLHKKPDDPRSLEKWADTNQLSAGMAGNEACLQCHTTLRANLAAHTKHKAEAGNVCYNCHMPYTSYGLLRALRSHQVSSPSVATSVSTGRPNACNLCHLDKTLAWTSEHLEEWYRTPRPTLTEDERTISASVLWMLRGDAGQRALVAWGAGWPPAEEASGTDWMAPVLGQLLNDPYEAVRLIASRSLGRLPGFRDFSYDFLAQPDVRLEAVSKAVKLWQIEGKSTNRPANSELLLKADGGINLDVVNRLKRERNDRRISLRE